MGTTFMVIAVILLGLAAINDVDIDGSVYYDEPEDWPSEDIIKGYYYNITQHN